MPHKNTNLLIQTKTAI